VLQNENNYDRDVFNGDLGLVVKITSTEQVMHLAKRELLNPIQRACNSSEGIGLDAKALQEGDEKQGERFFLNSDFILPASISIDSGACLIVVVAFAEL